MSRDIRHAIRLLAKTPAFSGIAILALALGIGLATTMFTTVNALLLRPIPHMVDEDRIVYVAQYPVQRPERQAVTLPDFRELKKASSLEGLAAYTELTVIVSEAENPVRYLGAQISADAFALLGVKPILGRLFRPEEDDLSAEPVALLGYDLWQKQFGGDPSILGRIIPINGRQTTVVGVMPQHFRFPEVSDLWLPLQLDEEQHGRGTFALDAIGKLKPGVSLAQARAELEAIGARLALEYPETNAGFSVRIEPWREWLVKYFRTLTLLVLGAVLFVHLIACANVANLLLARGATRAKEIGVRIALGASRGQIVRQLLTESFLLSAAGSALGLLFAVWGVDLMLSAVPTEIPAWIQFTFDWRIFSFALGLGVFSTVLIGLVPALQSSRPDLLEVLKEGGRGGGAGPRSQRIRSVLIIGEVALALILLIGAGLMVRSFLNLARADIGADPSSTLTFRVGLPAALMPEEKSSVTFFERLIPRLAALPGVESVGATSSLPAGGMGLSAVILEGEAPPERLQDARTASQVAITPGFFETARISLLRGRGFTVADNADAPRVALIDERAARTWFPQQDPIGRQLRIFEGPDKEPEWATVVGIVEPVVYHRLTREPAPPAVYFPHAQKSDWRFMSVAMRTRSDPKGFAEMARQAVLALNPDLPIYRVATLEQAIAETFWERRFFSQLFTTFGVLALFLAAIGLYGVMSYSVRQRTQEIGVRMALGAQARDVIRLITVQGFRLIGLGLAIGFVGAYFLMTLFARSLHGVSAHDPISFVSVGVLLLLVGLLASYIPARWATRLNPIEALRHE